MDYQIGPGIKPAKLPAWLKEAAKKYGTFDDGRVNYKNSDSAPVVMITVVHDDEILIVKRGYGLADAEGVWSTVNGFIDEDKPVAKIASQELKEELDLNISPKDIKVADSYTVTNPEEKRSYIVFPCLVKLDHKPKITLDREHTEFTWTTKGKIGQYGMLQDTPATIDAALALL